MNEKQVLSALGDLTNGALNYYQVTQTVMVRDNLIRNYIELLQKQNTELKEENEKLRKQNTEYQDEIFARDNSWYDMQD
jgi:cell division protein FtsB